MGVFDTIGKAFAPDITGAAAPGLYTGYNLAMPYLSQGYGNLQQGYGSAIPTVQQGTAEALPYLQSVFNTGQTGVDQLQKLLGIGAGGDPSTMQTALASMPGYQFTRDQGLEAIARARQAGGGGAGSGAGQVDAANYVTGLADKTYQEMVQNFNPFLNLLTSGATGAANVINQGATNVAGLQAGQGQALATQGNLQGQLGANLGGQLSALKAQQATADANYGIGVVGGGLNLLTGQNFFGGGGGGMAGAGKLAMGGFPFSDERLKKDVEKVGELHDGLGVFKYRYLWDDTPRIGVMAQDVEKKYPDAVVDIGGYKAVDYDRATSRAAQLARFLEAA